MLAVSLVLGPSRNKIVHIMFFIALVVLQSGRRVLKLSAPCDPRSQVPSITPHFNLSSSHFISIIFLHWQLIIETIIVYENILFY